MMVVMLSGCDTFDSFKYTFIEPVVETDNNTIYIGVYEPLTGRYSDHGLSEAKGIRLANSIFNSVGGYNVELIEVDTKSSTSVAETAIQGLIEMKPVAIIGSSGEAASLIASKYITKANIPTITPSATNPLITQNSGYYFRAAITESQMGVGIAEYAIEKLGSKRIGIATAANDTAATALLDGFDDKLDKLEKAAGDEDASSTSDSDSDEEKKEDKGPVVLREQVEFNEAGMKSLIKKMKKKNVSVMFIPQGTETMDMFFDMVEKNGLSKVVFIGVKNWANDDFVQMMKKHPKIKVVFPYDAALDEDNAKMTDEAQRFRVLYQNKYGADDYPDNYAALGYDSYLLLINAIGDANSTKGEDIRDALLGLSGIKGTTGVFEFDSKGNTVRPVTFYSIKKSGLESVYTTKSTAKVKSIEDVSKQEEEAAKAAEAEKKDKDKDKDKKEEEPKKVVAKVAE